MRKDSFAFAIAGMFFGLIVGWIIGSQQARPGAARPPAPAAAAAPARAQGQTAPTTAPVTSAGGQTAAVLDETRARTLATAAGERPKDAAVRIELANMYFDAERYSDAIRWYEEALALDPKNADVSTDLAVSYYYTNQTDRALEQFDRSLAINPAHTKTLLNKGIVRAFGKQDLQGAAELWEQVVKLAPESAEGRTAKQALDSMRSAHPPGGTSPGTD